MEYIQSEYELTNSKAQKIIKQKQSIETGNIGWIIIGGIWCVIWFALAFAGLGDGEWGQTILGIIMIFVGIKGIKHFNRKYDLEKTKRETKAMEYYNREYPPVADKIRGLTNEAKSIIESENYQNARVLIPDDYFDIDSVSCISRILQNRRANNLTEAINLYETDLHQRRVESAADRSADAQERFARAAEQQALYERDIARNTKSTARATKLNTFINLMK